jgi:hypothetical protein
LNNELYPNLEARLAELSPAEKDWLLRRCLTYCAEWAIASASGPVRGLNFEQALIVHLQAMLTFKDEMAFKPQHLERFAVALVDWEPEPEQLEAAEKTLAEFMEYVALKRRIREIRRQDLKRPRPEGGGDV